MMQKSANLPVIQLIVEQPGAPDFNFNQPANNMDFLSRVSSYGS